MCVALIGGMDRLKRDYMAAAREKGHDLKLVSRNERGFEDKIGNPDAIVIFTNKISHEARRKAMALARSRNIPVQLLHSCGVSTLRQSLKEF